MDQANNIFVFIQRLFSFSFSLFILIHMTYGYAHAEELKETILQQAQANIVASDSYLTMLQESMQAKQYALETTKKSEQKALERLRILQQFALDDPAISTVTTQKRYAILKQKRESLEQSLIVLGDKLLVAQAQHQQRAAILKTVKIVTVRGEASCGNDSIKVCKQHALEQAKRMAVEEGANTLINTFSEVNNFTLITDEIRSNIQATILQYKVIDTGFIGESGFFYIIRAKVKPKIPLLTAVTTQAKNIPKKPKIWQDPTTAMQFSYIPAGDFFMGSPKNEKGRDSDEKRHKVSIKKGFWLGVYEVTFEQYNQYCKDTTTCKTPKDNKWGQGKRPVINVSYIDALKFTAWLSKKSHETFTIPTEAEWEYAARAGTTTAFYTGVCVSSDQANYDANKSYNKCRKGLDRKKTIAVGSFPANAWGLHDTAGNVWEWTSSVFAINYSGSELLDASLDSDLVLQKMAVRGGSWKFGAKYTRSANRYRFSSNHKHISLGFRVKRTIP
ncbi:MAG: SUMF1/EgtB/PvdO family nonheme iron enzyme [Mariprofundales bacterium]